VRGKRAKITYIPFGNILGLSTSSCPRLLNTMISIFLN
jgi:hypothetical protein